MRGAEGRVSRPRLTGPLVCSNSPLPGVPGCHELPARDYSLPVFFKKDRCIREFCHDENILHACYRVVPGGCKKKVQGSGRILTGNPHPLIFTIQPEVTSCTMGTQVKTVIASIIMTFSLIILLRCTG